MREAKLEADVKQFEKENGALRKYILQLQGEVYGARLAAKYLDKELAGRYVNCIGPYLKGEKKNWSFKLCQINRNFVIFCFRI